MTAEAVGISDWQDEAIGKFVNECTVPLLYHSGGKVPVRLFGTGTLFASGDQFFIITAGHIFDGSDVAGRLSYPDGREEGGVYTLGRFHASRPEDGCEDVAIIQLLENKTIDRLSAGWSFLPLESVALPNNEGTFFLAAYPAELGWADEDGVAGGYIRIYSEQKSAPSYIPDHREGLDLYFEYRRSGRRDDGSPWRTPDLRGSSGGGVWQHQPDSDGLWTPTRATKVVAVQSQFRHSEYFRAKSWIAVARLFRREFPSVAPGQLDELIRRTTNRTGV